MPNSATRQPCKPRRLPPPKPQRGAPSIAQGASPGAHRVAPPPAEQTAPHQRAPNRGRIPPRFGRSRHVETSERNDLWRMEGIASPRRGGITDPVGSKGERPACLCKAQCPLIRPSLLRSPTAPRAFAMPKRELPFLNNHNVLLSASNAKSGRFHPLVRRQIFAPSAVRSS
jgi:hypothetical protein